MTVHEHVRRATRPVYFSVLPGLAAAGGAVLVAWLVHAQVDSFSPLVVSVLLGVCVANTVGVAEALRPGLKFASKCLLRCGVVLLGLQLSVAQLRDIGGRGLGVVV